MWRWSEQTIDELFSLCVRSSSSSENYYTICSNCVVSIFKYPIYFDRFLFCLNRGQSKHRRNERAIKSCHDQRCCNGRIMNFACACRNAIAAVVWFVCILGWAQGGYSYSQNLHRIDVCSNEILPVLLEFGIDWAVLSTKIVTFFIRYYPMGFGVIISIAFSGR